MPRPARKPFETKRAYASRLIRHYHHEGYPHAQAIAIGLRVAGVPNPHAAELPKPSKRRKKTRAPSR